MSSLVQLCTDNGFNLKPDIVHVDFEESMMKVIRSIFPATIIKCCRFHLGQAWWRKIQNLGLANEYKDSANSEIGKLLTAFFGLADTYITQESLFPPHLWAEAPSEMKRTNNGPESFHCHYNGQFYSNHPSIHVFLEVILDQQATTCIKMRNMTEQAPQPRIEREKTDFVVDAFQKYSSGEISRDHYVRSVRFRYRANTEM
jgi:hypothetical protein